MYLEATGNTLRYCTVSTFLSISCAYDEITNCLFFNITLSNSVKMIIKYSRNILNVVKRHPNLKNNSSSSAVTNVKPYHEIPGPPGKGLPFIGHMNLTSKKPHGLGKFWLNMEILQQKYLKDHDKLMRLNLGKVNPDGDGRYVLLYDPTDVEKVHRNEGKYPTR